MKLQATTWTLGLLLGFALFSCNKEEEEAIFAEADLIGTWTVTSSEVSIPGSGLPAKDLEQFGDLFGIPSGSVIEFKSSNEYEQVSEYFGFTSTIEGTWKLEGGKTLIMTDDGEETKYEVKSLNGEATVWYLSEKIEAEDINIPGISGSIETTINLKK